MDNNPFALPEAKLQLSAWSIAAFCCFGLAILANAVCWASLRGATRGDPTGLAGLAVFAAHFLSTLVLTSVGTLCGWLGVKKQPVRKRCAMTAIILNGVPCGLCLTGWLFPIIMMM